MKILNKILLVGLVFAIGSCGLTDLDELDNPNAVTAESAELSLYFNAIQLAFVDFFMDSNDLANPVVRATAMTGGNTYDNQYGATAFNFIWNRAYADLLPDMQELITAAEAEGITTYSGAGKFMKAYTLMTLVDFFGNVPYSQAGQGVSVPSPTADDQLSIYNEALSLIDGAIADFSTVGPDIGSVDLFYGGNAESWLKAANTLKLKWAMTTRLVNGNTVDASNIIDEPSEDFVFNFFANRLEPDARHWWYANHYEVDGNDYLSNYYMWSLTEEKGMEDPRTKYYFYRQDLTPKEDIDAFALDCVTLTRPLHYTGPYPFCVADNGYWGRDHGNNDGIPPDNNRRACYGVYPAGGKFDNGVGGSVKNNGVDGGLGAGIAPILMSSFSHFWLAENAVVTNGDGAGFLETGVRQSIEKVMGFGSVDPTADATLFPTSDDVDAYVATVMDAYNAANNDGKLDIIMKEYHIAAWGNGIEMYNNYRRTGYPSNMQPTLESISGDFPRLFIYPADYINLNANISNQRDQTDQSFWDTNPAGFIN